MENKDVLGRGLKSLIPEEVEGELKKRESVVYLKISEISIDEYQPRKNMDEEKIAELAQSIKEHGILQPLIVTKKEEGYHLVAGQRRLKAAQKAGLEEVPAVLKDADGSKKLEMSLIENIQREDLNPLEEAEAFKTLVKKFNLETRDIAQKVGKAETTVINSVRLLSLPQEVKDALLGNLITQGHARAILTLPKEEQLKLLTLIIKRNLTVREVETRAKRFHEGKESQAKEKVALKDLYLEEISGELRDILQTKVEIQKKGKGGRILIDYYSKEELERLIELFKKIKNYIEGGG